MCLLYVKEMAEEAEQQVLAPTTCLKVIGWKELSFLYNTKCYSEKVCSEKEI